MIFLRHRESEMLKSTDRTIHWFIGLVQGEDIMSFSAFKEYQRPMSRRLTHAK
jgi:hypothetical protein